MSGRGGTAVGRLGEPSGDVGRYHPMPIILLFIFGLLFAGALFALSGKVEGWGKSKRFTDKDADGEPDEPKGPAHGI